MHTQTHTRVYAVPLLPLTRTCMYKRDTFTHTHTRTHICMQAALDAREKVDKDPGAYREQKLTVGDPAPTYTHTHTHTRTRTRLVQEHECHATVDTLNQPTQFRTQFLMMMMRKSFLIFTQLSVHQYPTFLHFSHTCHILLSHTCHILVILNTHLSHTCTQCPMSGGSSRSLLSGSQATGIERVPSGARRAPSQDGSLHSP
jgi:hypothetical protein